MTTLEKNLTTVAEPQDLEMIRVIIKGFEYYDCYYGNMCKLKLELKYREYSTLKEDMKCFLDTTELQLGKYSIKELGSLKRSLMMLKDRYEVTGCNLNSIYINFLNDSILNLDQWINEVIDVIVSQIG